MRPAAGGAPVAVELRGMNRATKVRTSLYNTHRYKRLGSRPNETHRILYISSKNVMAINSRKGQEMEHVSER
jgi:hypothetical protein